MLFKQTTLQAIERGDVTVAFRRWRRPTVRAGGTLTTRIGVLAIETVTRILLRDITAKAARAAGYPDVAELEQELAKREGTLYRVTFRLVGEDPRIKLRSRAKLSTSEVAEVKAQVARWDRASRSGPWAVTYLEMIRRSPGVRAGDLASEIDVDTPKFKTNVRKLKAIGLTESLEVGYRLSPRGKAALRALK